MLSCAVIKRWLKMAISTCCKFSLSLSFKPSETQFFEFEWFKAYAHVHRSVIQRGKARMNKCMTVM